MNIPYSADFACHGRADSRIRHCRGPPLDQREASIFRRLENRIKVIDNIFI